MRFSKGRFKGKFKNKLKKRTPSLVPNLITLFGICAGLTSIRMAMLSKWDLAVIAVLIAALFDFMDGRIARILNGTSKFGAELDSLSDMVNFGVAPSLIVYIKTTHSLEEIGWAGTLFFTACMAIRLARFNVTSSDNDVFFKGVPAPSAGLLGLSSIVFSIAFPSISLFKTPEFSFVTLILSGILMVSTVPTFSPKKIKIPHSYFSVVLVCLFASCVFLISKLWETLSFIIILYILTIPISFYISKRTIKNSL